MPELATATTKQNKQKAKAKIEQTEPKKQTKQL